MDSKLAFGGSLERILMATLTGLFLLALAVTVCLRRRMAHDLLRPMATMRENVVRLQAGDYSSRIDAARPDELAQGFRADGRRPAQQSPGPHASGQAGTGSPGRPVAPF
jgi:hypothetical protein